MKWLVIWVFHSSIISRYEYGICLIMIDYLLILLHHLEARVDVFLNVSSNIFEENKDISLQYYNLFFLLIIMLNTH